MKKKRVFFAFLIVVPQLVALIIFELVFGGWLANKSWMATNRLNIIRNKTFRYSVNFTKRWTEDGAVDTVYTRDRWGLRSTCPSSNKAEFITLGGSTTNQKFISDGKTWQDVLQTLLRERTQSSSLCIANAGVDGHSTFGHIKSFDLWFPLIDNFKPKFFLLYLGINDAGFRFEEQVDYDNNNHMLMSAIEGNSALFRLWSFFLREDAKHNNKFAVHGIAINKQLSLYSESSQSENSQQLILKNVRGFERRLSIIMSKILSIKAIPICITQPHALAWKFDGKLRGISEAFSYKDKVYNGIDYDNSLDLINGAMAKICKGAGGIVIDMKNKDFDLVDFYDYVHMNTHGAEKVGRYIYEEMVAQNIVK